MSPRPEVLHQAADFASNSLQSLLNRTVATGITIRAVLASNEKFAVVGCRVSDRDFVGALIRLGTCFLYLKHILYIDHRGYLTDTESKYAVFVEDDFNSQPLFRYEYVRDNPRHPSAHLHFHASPEAFERLFQKAGRTQRAEVPRLHFPVGGKRFRPVLEDIIEFLVIEDLVPHSENWKEVVEEHRADWHKKQLRAAVQADPETAQEALDDLHKGNP